MLDLVLACIGYLVHRAGGMSGRFVDQRMQLLNSETGKESEFIASCLPAAGFVGRLFTTSCSVQQRHVQV